MFKTVTKKTKLFTEKREIVKEIVSSDKSGSLVALRSVQDRHFNARRKWNQPRHAKTWWLQLT